MLGLTAKYRGNHAAPPQHWGNSGRASIQGMTALRSFIVISSTPRVRDGKKGMVLHRRVKRNPEDGWAWRELTFRRISDYERSAERRQDRLRPQIEHLLAQCDRTAPDSPATRRMYALWCEARGDWAGAIDMWRKAIEADSGSLFSYRHLLDCSSRLGDLDRDKVFHQIEPKLLSYASHLFFARDICFLLAQRLGVVAAEKVAKRWSDQRPDDPEVALAYAGLLLEYGHGKSDATRSKSILQPAVTRFPYHAREWVPF